MNMMALNNEAPKRAGMAMFSAMTAMVTLALAGHPVSAQDADADEVATSDFVIINNDGLAEGFNDPTPVEPVAGNMGTTLGEQRLAVFEAAAEVWEAIIVSDVPITVQAQFDELTCTSDTAVLGSAGPVTVAADFPGALVPGTFYVAAQANQQAGIDLDPVNADINATFNSRLGAPDCLANRPFFLGIDGTPAPEGTIDLFDTVLHEVAHGLGFLSLVDQATGAKFFDTDDIFSNNLEDDAVGRPWPELSNEERAQSVINTGNLQWFGVRATTCAAQSFEEGTANDGDILMYAPNPSQPGSSVSHFDTSLTPDELMEPFATETSVLDLTVAAFVDMGWPISEAAAASICQQPVSADNADADDDPDTTGDADPA